MFIVIGLFSSFNCVALVGVEHCNRATKANWRYVITTILAFPHWLPNLKWKFQNSSSFFFNAMCARTLVKQIFKIKCSNTVCCLGSQHSMWYCSFLLKEPRLWSYMRLNNWKMVWWSGDKNQKAANSQRSGSFKELNTLPGLKTNNKSHQEKAYWVNSHEQAKSLSEKQSRIKAIMLLKIKEPKQQLPEQSDNSSTSWGKRGSSIVMCPLFSQSS